jgi:hypothetical protein
MSTRRFAAVFLGVLALPLAAYAASPSLGGVLPRGGQRGTEVDLVFTGDRLSDAQDVLIYQPGVTVSKFEIVNNNQLKVKVKVAPDARLGEYSLRVRTLTGISDLRTFYVGALPQVDEKEPNSDFATPQKIPLNVTVAGFVDNEDVDYYLVEAKQGQRITAEVEGIRLGLTLFDPYVSIMDMNRFDLATSDDSALLLQDPVASVIAPKDGTYVIQVRESSYGGNGNCVYRLHVGTFPRPRMAYPAGGKAGDDLNLNFVGDVSGPILQSFKLPGEPSDKLGLFAEQNKEISPSPCFVRVSPFANVMEVEPNNDPSTATKATGELPLAFNGIIEKDKDADFFRFNAKKGQVLDVRVYARALRSPLDSVLVIHDGKGNGLASNDDSGGPDSYLRFTVPADGEYVFQVYDHLQRGSADAVYRVEITPVNPALTLSIPLVANNSQERQTVVVPKGNRFATLVRATRADFGGEVTVTAEGLPAGVTQAAENVQPNLDVVPVVFEAAPTAAVGGKIIDLVGKPVDANVKLKSQFVQLADLVVGNNAVPFYQAKVDKLAVAVVDEAPFTLQIVQPKVPLVQQGQMMLKVVAQRKPGFAGGIHLRMLFDPPGVGSGQVDMPGDKSEALLPLNASGGAQVRKWKICVLGNSDQPAAPAPAKDQPAPAPGTVPAAGPVWVSTQLAELEIAPPLVLGKIEMAATEQGKPAPVLCKLDPKTKFDGKGKLQLVGLPPNTTAAGDVEIAADAKEAVFNVNVTDKTPAGQHNQLACILTVIKDGEPIVQTVSAGGVLRVDPPPPKAAAEPAKAAPAAAAPQQATAAAKAPEKILSRLEKLRLEQAAKGK